MVYQTPPCLSSFLHGAFLFWILTWSVCSWRWDESLEFVAYEFNIIFLSSVYIYLDDKPIRILNSFLLSKFKMQDYPNHRNFVGNSNVKTHLFYWLIRCLRASPMLPAFLRLKCNIINIKNLGIKYCNYAFSGMNNFHWKPLNPTFVLSSKHHQETQN